MKKIRKSKIVCLLLVLGVAMSGTVLNASSLTKTLKAVYNNIAVSYNGQTKTLSTKPFTVNGITYVPLRAIGEIMGASVSWANNTVSITGQTTSMVSNEQEIAAKNFEIASLKQQLELAKAELAADEEIETTAEDSNLTTSDISDTLNQIENDYEEEYDIDWEFDLDIVSDELELTVYYDSGDNDALDEMTESERRAFIKSICYDIADNHEDVAITGTLEDSYEAVEIAEFGYSASGSFTYEEEENYSLSEFEDELEDDYDEINCLDFDISIESIELDEEDDDELAFTINVDLDDYSDEWNSLTSSDEDELEYFLEEIIGDIEDEFSAYDEINGTVEDTSYGVIVRYEDGYVSIYQAE